jgi:formylglycine-generating enzyme required for sulfatase activity
MCPKQEKDATMALIPEGEFLMGATDDNDMGYTGAFQGELPQHTVNLDAFYMDTHLVTVDRYHRFMLATGYHPEHWVDDWINEPEQPVRGIRWEDALAFSKWAGKRLPTEAEWEKAARGGLTNQQFPWGNDDFDGSQAPALKKEDSPPPIGSFPPNGYGLYDMTGSLWQWCHDDRRLYTADHRHCPIGPVGGETRSVRGGDWYSHPFHKRCSRRGGAFLDRPTSNAGVRCVCDVTKTTKDSR